MRSSAIFGIPYSALEFIQGETASGGLEAFEAERLKGPGSENAKLKKLPADAMLHKVG
jgi:hypothetical protein